MSHFVAIVITPDNTEPQEMGSAISQLLEPYSEHISVREYETECGCIGCQALLDVKAAMNKKCDMDKLQRKFQRLPEKKRTDARWAKMTAPVIKKQRKLLAAHPLADKPNPDCTDCNGTGRFMSRCNPQGKWDWWVIGGRWDGWIFGPEREEASKDKAGGFNADAEHHTPENNTRRVSDIPSDEPHYVPFAIVTPEGEWLEQGEMGWWAHVKNEKEFDHWHKIMKETLAQYPDHLAVAVDCHV